MESFPDIAMEPFHRIDVDMENWKEAAVRANNLSELEVTLGLLREAVANPRLAVEFADRSGDSFEKMDDRTALADTLFQAGDPAAAKTLFAEAERIQVKWQPEFPQFYSLAGFRYVDLLLTVSERAAWRAILCRRGLQFVTQPHDGARDGPATECAEADRRATQTLKWGIQHGGSLLNVALDELSLARTRLYRALPLPGPKREIGNLPSEMPAALAKLRQANALHHLPKGLLTAAFYAGTLGKQPEEARRYLAEAQQIAERGPMPLYLADAHLHRARLFRDKAELAKARGLIEKHGATGVARRNSKTPRRPS